MARTPRTGDSREISTAMRRIWTYTRAVNRRPRGSPTDGQPALAQEKVVAGEGTRSLTRTDLVAVGLLVLFLVALFLWLTLISPRPYTIVENDLENDYFYNSLTYHDGYACLGSRHPGMPARFSFLILFRLFGADTGPQLQAALNWSYGGIFLLTAAAVVWFHVRVRSFAAPWPSFLAAIVALTTPPAMGFYNHFGSDSFVLPFGLVLVGLGWTMLRGGRPPLPGAMAGVGAVSGLCLSTKLTFFPIVMALGLSLTLAAVLRSDSQLAAGGPRSQPRRAFAAATSFWFALAAAHLLICLPLGTGLFWVWRHTLTRPDAFPTGGSVLYQVARSAAHLLEVDPGLMALLVASVAVLIWRAVGRWLGLAVPARAVVSPTVPEVVFLVGSLAGLAYTLAASSFAVGTFRDAGFSLRNTGPSLLVLPVLILCAWGGSQASGRSTGSSKWALLAAVVVATFATAAHVARRERFLGDYTRYSAAATGRFAELRRPGTRVAVWEKNACGTLGEINFRLWGNYRWYRQDAYDDITLSRFPEFTFFPLRDVGRPDRPPDTGLPPVQHSRRGAARLVALLAAPIHRVQQACLPYRDTSEYGRVEGRRAFFTGEGRGVEVSLIAYPASHERRELRVTRAELLELISARLGPAECWEEDLGGLRWVLIRIADRPSGQ